MDPQTALLTKFENRTATVAVIGLGYVGLPLAVAFAEAGFSVVGLDVDPRKVDAVNRGESYIEDIPSERLKKVARGRGGAVADGRDDEATKRRSDEAATVAQQTASEGRPWAHRQPGSSEEGRTSVSGHGLSSIVHGRLSATTDFSTLAHVDAAIICVPTPLNKTGEPDISYILAAAQAVAEHLHPGMLVVLESTTYPGTTTEVVLPILRGDETTMRRGDDGVERIDGSSNRRIVGSDFYLAFSPERIDPGNREWPLQRVPKVVGGVTPACRELTCALYRQIVDRVVPVSSPAAAEMTKLLENTFRVVNIALVNEVAIMCDRLGLDVWEIVDAAATKPFGFMKFTPGPGIGGHCIPVDPQYLSWKLRLLDYNARFVQLATEVNREMPRYWVQKVVDALNEQCKAVKGSRILVLGVAYKRDVNDIRESPVLDIMVLLQAKGGTVVYHDPHVPHIRHQGLEWTGVQDLDQALADADCVLIGTDHSAYDWDAVRARARVIVDTRGVLRRKGGG